MKALLIILFPSILVSLASSSLVNAVQQRTSNPIAENPCSSYRVWVLRPILDRFVKVNSSEELKVQVNAMAETIKDLQSQITCKEEQLVEKTKEIKDQRGKVNVLAANIKHLRSELVTAKAEIKNKDKQIQFNFEKISEITEELLECKPKGFCPSEGPSGIYNITMRGIDSFRVPCNSKGWLTIQKRFDGSENFDRPWKDYKDGFGNTTGEFFIGLEKMHHMTHEQPHELYIALRKIDGSTSYAHYKDFKIGSEEESYALKALGTYEGTAGDSLRVHENKKFTTFDRDNDSYKFNCAADEYGGWWYYNCAQR